MTKGKKVILLLIAFGFPIVLILLFEFDSKGVYEVALLYEQGVANPPATCNYQYAAPYVLPDSVTKDFLSKKPDLVIISLDTTSSEAKQNLNRIQEQFKDDNVSVRVAQVGEESMLKQCVFLSPGDSSIVLIDVSGRIRGHYNGTKREDIDRLFDESKIILKKY